MKVKDRSGQTWRVTRRWVPWRRRTKGFLDTGPGIPLGDDPISAVIGTILLIIFLPFLILFGLELLALLLVLPFAILGRVLFGRHWTIEARRGFEPYWEERVGDWSASRERIREVARLIEQGSLPTRSLTD